MAKITSKITPFLWYVDKAEEAARFYVSLFPDSRIDGVTALPTDSPSGPPGAVQVIEFTLAGQSFLAMTAGGADPFNHAISLLVNCENQAEIDRLWDALSEGGKVEQCGWLKDRYGVSWQIAPADFAAMMKDPDRAKARRFTEAMMQMVKFDIAALRKAFDGD